MTDAQLIQLPMLGEDLDVATPPGAVRALRAVTEFQRDLGNLQRACRETLRAEADSRGQRTFEVDGVRVTVENPTLERVYDVAKLQDGLAAAGLDVMRLAELVTYEPRVDGKVIRQLERHPAYRSVIDSCIIQVKEKTRRVEVG